MDRLTKIKKSSSLFPRHKQEKSIEKIMEYNLKKLRNIGDLKFKN